MFAIAESIIRPYIIIVRRAAKTANENDDVYK